MTAAPPLRPTPAVCEECGLRYALTPWGDPATDAPYTCDDCGGYVEVPDEEERDELSGG